MLDLDVDSILIKPNLSFFSDLSSISFLENSLKYSHLTAVFSQMFIKKAEKFMLHDDRLAKFLNLLEAYLLNFLKEKFNPISNVKNLGDIDVIWGFILKSDPTHSAAIAKALYNIYELGMAAKFSDGQLYFYYD